MLYEAEVLPGLKDFAVNELLRQPGNLKLLHSDRTDTIPFRYAGDPQHLLTLATVVAIYQSHHFAIPRPRAFLGHEHFHRLLDIIQALKSNYPPGTFQTFRFSAAGQDSSVFVRLRTELEQHSGLHYAPADADLYLRIRTAQHHDSGWEILTRLTPRPLATRHWRHCDMPGALNATIAAAMIDLTQPQPEDRFLNLMCGSGTLLIERQSRLSASANTGIDLNPAALRCARQNITAANLQNNIHLHHMDATQLAFPASTFNVLCADFPWGQLVGDPDQLDWLYPAVLAEAARVATPGASFVLITHAMRLFEATSAAFSNLWELKQELQVFQGGLHPRIYRLERL